MTAGFAHTDAVSSQQASSRNGITSEA
jgi:hypothetical protein